MEAYVNGPGRKDSLYVVVIFKEMVLFQVKDSVYAL